MVQISLSDGLAEAGTAALSRPLSGSAGGLRLDRVEGGEALALLGPDWDRLAAVAPEATSFVTAAWTRGALTLDPARTPVILRLRRGDRLVGALPLTIGKERASGVPLRTARIAGFPLTDRFTFLVDPEVPEATGMLLDATLDLPVDVVLLTEALESAAAAGAIRRWILARNLRAASRLASEARSFALEFEDAAGLEARYPIKHRTNTRRTRRRLDEAGQVGFDHLRPKPAEVGRMIERLKAVEDRAWQGQGGTGIFSSTARLPWLADVLEALAADGALFAEVMTIDGEDAMYMMGMAHRGVFYYYNTAFVPGRIRGSAFSVLLHEMMQELRRAGLQVIDTSRNTLGVEHMFDHLRPDRLEHRHFAIFNATLPAWIYRTVLLDLRPALHALRARLRKAAPLVQKWTVVGRRPDGEAAGGSR